VSIETLILIIAAVSAASAIFGFALSRAAEGRKLRLSRHEHDRLDAILATVPEPGPTLERSCELIQEDATEALGRVTGIGDFRSGSQPDLHLGPAL
jgi:hypothetical protein